MNKDRQIKCQSELATLCIPRMDASISAEFILQTFQRLNVCKVNKIIEIPLKDSDEYKRIIMTVVWYNNDISANLMEKLANGESIKVVYDMPWFWKVVLATKK